MVIYRYIKIAAINAAGLIGGHRQIGTNNKAKNAIQPKQADIRTVAEAQIRNG